LFLNDVRRKLLWANRQAFADFIRAFRDFVERVCESLDVLALNRRGKGRAKVFGNNENEFFFFFPRKIQFFKRFFKTFGTANFFVKFFMSGAFLNSFQERTFLWINIVSKPVILCKKP